MDNNFDISSLSEIKKQMLAMPDDVLRLALNVANTMNANKVKEKAFKGQLQNDPLILDSDTHSNDILPKTNKQNIFQKAKSLAKAYASRGFDNKKAPQEVKDLRILSCHGNNELSPCPYRKNSEKYEGSFYCGECGCGDKSNTQLINLTVDGKESYSKLDFPSVYCPLAMPGFINYEKSEETSDNSRKVFIEKLYSVEYIMNNSNIELKKESENDENSDNNKTEQENS
jgi:hypothetical protein